MQHLEDGASKPCQYSLFRACFWRKILSFHPHYLSFRHPARAKENLLPYSNPLYYIAVYAYTDLEGLANAQDGQGNLSQQTLPLVPTDQLKI